MKQLLLTFTAITTFIPCAAFASLAGVKGTISNVETAIETAVKQAEKLYEQNGGVEMASQFDALQAGSSNPYTILNS